MCVTEPHNTDTYIYIRMYVYITEYVYIYNKGYILQEMYYGVYITGPTISESEMAECCIEDLRWFGLAWPDFVTW